MTCDYIFNGKRASARTQSIFTDIAWQRLSTADVALSRGLPNCHPASATATH
jgi:hypothetical protein